MPKNGKNKDHISDITENLKSFCVTKRGKWYYYPKTIPRERGSMTCVFIFLLFVCFTAHLYMADERLSLISLYTFSFIIYCAIVLLYRTVLFFFELDHSHSRYNDNIIKIFQAAYKINFIGRLMFFICGLYAVYYVSTYGRPCLSSDYLYFVMAFLFFLHKLLDLDSNPISDSLWIATDNGLDYGSGMAYSFFYGYLNYILPKTGDAMKNLQEMMQDYESSHDITFDYYKIFILIPKSLTCHVDISEVSNFMEMRHSLADKVITVAGVRERIYKNSVYSIEHESTGSIVYVCCEYATPLKTFKEVVKNNTSHTEYYLRHKNDILLQFYLTLKKILEHEGMERMCELVYYEDMDENGNYLDVGRIILSRLGVGVAS